MGKNTKDQLDLFGCEMINIQSNDSENKEALFYMKGKNRQLIPINGDSISTLAQARLHYLRENYHIPNKYLENWNNIKLYNPNGDINNANAIFINPGEGYYSVNNKLNDLTGKEWTIFSCSWFVFNAIRSDLIEEKKVTLETQSHPATFSPTMVADFIKFFTKESSTVIDPFAGIGSTLVGAKRTNRIGYGIELNEKYYNIIKLRVPEFTDNVFNWDSTKLDELNLPLFDYSISSPPYWDVLNRSTDGFKKERSNKGFDSNYSTSNDDLGNIESYDIFLDKVCSVYEKLYAYMKNGAYITIIVKNVKKGGKLYPLAWDIASRLNKLYTLKDEKIWIQDKIGLSPYGYPNSWASNILHHYCLVFRKE